MIVPQRNRAADRRYLFRRFCTDHAGAAAVEFALIALPFITLLLAIIQISLIMFANQTLQSMTTAASRQIMTGHMAGKNLASFKTAICADGYTRLFDCDKLMVQVKPYTSFATANPSGFVNDACFGSSPPANCFDPGSELNIVFVRIAYDWPFGFNLETFSTAHRLVAVSVFRNEPS